MIDPRLNQRAPRVNGRARGRDADRAMQIWAWWWLEQRERGWPCETIEARLMVHGGELVRSQTPAGPRIPNIDRARTGPHVNRLLADMADIGPRHAEQAQALRLWALAGGSSAKAAQVLLVDERTVRRRVRGGLGRLNELLRWVPLERRQAETRFHVEQSAPIDAIRG